MSLQANYSVVIVSVLHQAWKIYGPFTRENHQDVARWVQLQVNEIRDRQSEYVPPAICQEFPR